MENLNNEENSPVVRHECAEALANYPEHSNHTLSELQKWSNIDIPILRSTVKLAIRKLNEFNPKVRYAKYN